MHISHCKLDWSHCTLYRSHWTIFRSHCTLYRSICTLYRSHWTLYRSHCTLGRSHCTIDRHCTLDKTDTIHHWVWPITIGEISSYKYTRALLFSDMKVWQIKSPFSFKHLDNLRCGNLKRHHIHPLCCWFKIRSFIQWSSLHVSSRPIKVCQSFINWYSS